MPKVNRPSGLTARQESFVREYLVDKNQTAAAMRAGYAPKGAKFQGCQLMAKPLIRAAVEKALAEQAARTLMTADQVLLDIQRIGDKAETDREYTAALRSRELIGRHFRMFTDKVELTGKNDGPVEFTELRRTIVRPKQ